MGTDNDDILLAGSLTPAAGTTVLEHLSGTLRDECISGRTCDQRVENVRNGPDATTNKLNGVFPTGDGETGQNVSDDGVSEDVLGSNDQDLFFIKLGSDLNDRLSRVRRRTVIPSAGAGTWYLEEPGTGSVACHLRWLRQ